MKGLLIVVLLIVASSASPRRVVLEADKKLEVADGWVPYETSFEKLPKQRIVIALKNRNLDKLDDLFWSVSDPKHDQYGQYLSLAELSALISPSRRSINTVLSWLQSEGITSTKTISTGDYVIAWASPSQLSSAFGTEVRGWVKGKQVTFRSVQPYSVPEHVAPHVDFVSGIHHFPSARKHHFGSTDAASMIGPDQIRARYNVSNTGSGIKGNAMAVAEFQGQYYSPSDLQQFFKSYVPNSGNDTVAKVVGNNQPNAPGVEAELDIQYIMGVAPNVPTWFYVQPSMDFWSGLTAWVASINDDPNAPLVHSVSYGEQREHAQSNSYKDRLDADFKKLGVRGLSILFASGDSGVGCSLCLRYEPSFPATCPSLTTVGATRFLSGTSGPEGAVEAFGSGGGFSWHFPRPPYQEAAVKHYLTNAKLPFKFHFNPKGRSTPDVAALGIGYSVVVNGNVESIGGTSASTPTFAAIVSLLNDIQLEAGKPPLGFLNPWLYSIESKQTEDAPLWDVTEGNNPDGCCGAGFHCAPGYDPVTGLGTPNFGALAKALP